MSEEEMCIIREWKRSWNPTLAMVIQSIFEKCKHNNSNKQKNKVETSILVKKVKRLQRKKGTEKEPLSLLTK